ncbi:MAG: N-6 DNA methylase [Phoenicibacter congonensis]|uniref:site-specific DNA-methyltransferase (adenine-specific) n=1 Tax=Phoenicibacter congonensis TaxID=1944646 RepID=A0AA43RHJ7_9ACTN|nr:N-6 DNA methylase [Phoenicibacter congonensis]
MAKRLAFDTPDAKEFVKTFNTLSQRHNPWTVWSDFIAMYACVLSLTFDRTDRQRFEDREKELQETSKRYTKQELTVFDRLFKITVESLARNPQQDFLGRLYMSLDFGRQWQGQFFTPWQVAYMMAQMTMGPAEDFLQGREYASTCDCCCGAGCMLLAAAAAYENKEKDRIPQRDLLLIGQDLDRTVALMCYIQLSILGYAGYVAVGNTLTSPIGGPVLFPKIGEGGELWFTPGWFTPVWSNRRQLEVIKLMFSDALVAEAPVDQEGGEE